MFDSEFNDIPERDKDTRVEGVDKIPAQMIAYQLVWMNLVMEWENKEKLGLEFQMPTAENKWKQLETKRLDEKGADKQCRKQE